MNILQIDSSIQGAASASRVLTREIVAQYQAAGRGTAVTHRDLATEELRHLSPAVLARTDQTEAARDAATLEQFLAADVIVIGAPIYNFSIPSQLRPGSTALQSRAAPSATRPQVPRDSCAARKSSLR
jgi:FMN-dependent NADH-azoreductase